MTESLTVMPIEVNYALLVCCYESENKMVKHDSDKSKTMKALSHYKNVLVAFVVNTSE